MEYFLPDELQKKLQQKSRHWLVTGAAGFIGSHLSQCLLQAGQKVTGLDDFSTGHRKNLQAVKSAVGAAFNNFRLVEGDIRKNEDVEKSCQGVDLILHHAALGSVPRSIAEPQNTATINMMGTLNVFTAAHQHGIRRVIYASSSAVYGDEATVPQVEKKIGRVLSPYALSKLNNEQWAEQLAEHLGLELVGLRYFNVFGPRQDPQGPYAAVIPKWIELMRHNAKIEIYGDGKTSRDFCFISNIVQANLAAALTEKNLGMSRPSGGWSQVYNVACNEQTSLNDLYAALREFLTDYTQTAEYRDFRAGDVRHSRASIDAITDGLAYRVNVGFKEGLKITLNL